MKKLLLILLAVITMTGCTIHITDQPTVWSYYRPHPVVVDVIRPSIYVQPQPRHYHYPVYRFVPNHHSDKRSGVRHFGPKR